MFQPTLRCLRRYLAVGMLGLVLIAGSSLPAQVWGLPAQVPDLKLTQAGDVRAIVYQPDGKAIVGGRFVSINGTHRNNLARLNPNGTVDATWAPQIIDGTVTCLALAGDDLFVGGDFAASVDGVGLLAQNLVKVSLGSGELSTNWSTNLGAADVPVALALDDASVYVGATTSHVIKLSRATGERDYSWLFPSITPMIVNNTSIPGYTNIIQTLLVDGNLLYVGGSFRLSFGVTNTSYTNLFRVYTDLNNSMANFDTNWSPRPNQTVRAMCLTESNLFVVGDFTFSAGAQQRSFAKIPKLGDGTPDFTWKPNTNSNLGYRSIAVSGTNLYVAGGFINNMGGQLRRNAVKVSTEGAGAPDLNWNPPFAATSGAFAWAVAARESEVLIGGKFETVGGENSLGVVRLDSINGLRDPTYAAQIEQAGEVRALAVQADGRIIVGGNFLQAGGIPRRNLLRVETDGSLDLSWFPNPQANEITNGVRTLALAEPYLFVGGSFTNIGGLFRTNLAKISLTDEGRADPLWQTHANQLVNVLARDGTNLFVGGRFTTIGGTNRLRLVKVFTEGSGGVDVSWNPGSIPGTEVNALALDGTNLFVGGTFTSIGGVSRFHLAKMLATGNGALDTNWACNIGSGSGLHSVRALAVAGTNLYVGGTFPVPGYLSGTSNLFRYSTVYNVFSNVTAHLYFNSEVHSLQLVDTNLYVGAADQIYRWSAEEGSMTLVSQSAPNNFGTFYGVPTSGGNFRAMALRGSDLIVGGSFRALYDGDQLLPPEFRFRNGFTLLPSISPPIIAQTEIARITVFPALGDSPEITHFLLSGLNGALLFKTNGITPVFVGEFLTAQEGAQGLILIQTQTNANVSFLPSLSATSAGIIYQEATLNLGNLPGAEFRFETAIYSVVEGTPQVTLSVRKYGAGAGSVAFTTISDTAAAGLDFGGSAGTLNFVAADTNKTINVAVGNDFIFRKNRRFFVSLTNSASGGLILQPRRAEVTIIDDDPVGQIDSVTNTLPPSLPNLSSAGGIKVNLSPAGANGQWRLVGDPFWRASGETAGGLTANSCQVEFKSVPGHLVPALQTFAVFAGSVQDYFLAYTPLAASSNGSLTVLLGPTQVTSPLNPTERAQWRVLGQTNWYDTRQSISNLVAGGYEVEFKPVSGWSTPLSKVVQVAANFQGNAITVAYVTTPAITAQTPALISPEIALTNSPYVYNGLLETELGFGSGFVVKERVVLTAGHVLFDDIQLTNALRVRWMFQKYRNHHEPAPQIPRGWYLFSGYADQRRVDNSPGISSPESQNLDVAALYFVEDQTGPNLPGRGGYGGFLYSPDPNTFLLGASNKFLAGYPVADVIATNVGKLHATAPTNLGFTRLYGDKSVYATTNVLSFSGNSGGPLYVQGDNGGYLPAGIFLGGQSKTLVRAIDSQVVDLINRAEESANGAGNSTGGGVIIFSPGVNAPPFGSGFLTVTLAPSNGLSNLPGWRVAGYADTNYYNQTPTTVALAGGGSYPVEFKRIPGFITPTNRTVTIPVGQTALIDAEYLAIRPQMRLNANGLTLFGDSGAQYRIEYAESLTSPVTWLPLTNVTVATNIFTLPATQPGPGATRFYRSLLLP